MQTLSTIEINPATPSIGTIILLHGLGADGNDFVPIVSEINALTKLPLRFVFPNAPHRAVTINNGYVMPAWYDITSATIQERGDHAGIMESVKQLKQIIEHEKTLGTPDNKIVLAGFSQGAVVALTTGLHYDKTLAGILAISGYLPFSETQLPDISAANRNTPIFIGHGTQDPIVPLAAGTAAFELVKKLGYNVTMHKYQMAHSVCEQEVVDIGAWLTAIFHH